MSPTPQEAWAFLPWGYLLTVLLEAPILLVGLSRRLSWRERLAAGLWLTACTYPIVVVVLPPLLWQPYGRGWYLLVAETFAPVAECVLFRLAYGAGRSRAVLWRDFAVITAANLVSFGAGELLDHLRG
ncbi:MAG: hypothetical protein RIC55_30200 [Pirellulaceae bacterium]